MNSPFKFLDAYTANDKAIFFGREKEIDALYNMVFKTPLVLVYGLSGTGKTSLVQCGLATRFDGPDWMPFLIRKKENINTSIRNKLNKALPVQEQSDDLNILVENLFYKYYRPVYLLFDQFEELFILGDPDEQNQFMKELQALQEAELPCRVILILREEYIGQLYNFEQIVPTLFDYKLRVEPMTNNYIREVMQESFKAFNIQLAEPKEERLQQMVNKLSSDKSNIPLTYLQVYLDMLYQEDYQRTYPEGIDEEFPFLEFTQKEIDDFGEIDDVLVRFLREKTLEIQTRLSQKKSNFSKDTVKKVLDAFVTTEGTKRPVYYTREDDVFELEQSIQDNLSLQSSHLSACLLELEEARLLRFRNDTIELAHDTLAARIDQQRTDEERALNEMRREIKSSYGVYHQTNDYLSLGQLQLYTPYLQKLNLVDDYRQFIEKSRAFHQQEAIRKEQELIQERDLRATAEKNEQKANRQRHLARISFSIASMIAVLAIILFFNARIAEEHAKQAEEIAQQRLNQFKKEEQKRKATQAQQLLTEAKTYIATKEYKYALKRLNEAQELNPNNQQIEKLIIECSQHIN